MIDYKFSEYYNETAVNSDNFPVTPEYYSSATGKYVKGTPTKYVSGTYKYNYVADIGGINAKFGVIWLPTDGLRLGAAIQTPTAYNVSELWYIDVSSEFADASQNASSSSATGSRIYLILLSP